MEKKWLSYRKIVIISWMIYLIILCGCENSENKFVSDDLLILEKEYRLKQPTPFDGSVSSVVDNRNRFYTSVLFAREIYRIPAPYDTFEVIGRRGQGPGEYQTPYYLFLFDDILYFSDINTPYIKGIYLKSHKTVDKPPLSLNVGFGGRQFCVDKKYVYVKNAFNPILTVYSKKSTLITDSLITIDDVFVETNMTINGGGIDVDSKNNIYISAGLPMDVYICKNINGHIQIQDTLDLSEIAGFETFSMNKFLELRRDSKNTQDPLNHLLSKINFVSKIKIIETRHDTLLIIAIWNKGKIIQIILSEKGELIAKLPSDFPVIIDGNENGLFFYTALSDDGYSLIQQYVIDSSQLEKKLKL